MAKKVEYKVEKLVDGEWYYEGTWESPERLGECMFELGKIAGVIDQVRVTQVEKEEE